MIRLVIIQVQVRQVVPAFLLNQAKAVVHLLLNLLRVLLLSQAKVVKVVAQVLRLVPNQAKVVLLSQAQVQKAVLLSRAKVLSQVLHRVLKVRPLRLLQVRPAVLRLQVLRPVLHLARLRLLLQVLLRLLHRVLKAVRLSRVRVLLQVPVLPVQVRLHKVAVRLLAQALVPKVVLLNQVKAAVLKVRPVLRAVAAVLRVLKAVLLSPVRAAVLRLSRRSGILRI